MLIVLEGLDGAGKSTQIALLENHFKLQNRALKFLHFPRFETPIYGDLIARFLRGEFGPNERVHPMLVALLFAQDRGSTKALLEEWLEESNIVILDRYIYSNIAFQCAKLADKEEIETLREWIFNFEYNHHKIPRPTLNLFLDVPLTFVEAKLSADREGEERSYLQGRGDIHEENIEFQRRVREIYLEECQRGEGLIRVDCSNGQGEMATPEEIFKRISDHIKKIER